MRMDDRTWTRHILTRVSESSDRMREISDQITTGRRIHKPSDDPRDYRRMLDLEAQNRDLEVQTRRFEEASGSLDGMDSVLGSLVDFARRARSITLQGTNAASDAEARNALATETDNLLKQAVFQANTQVAGVYLLSGSKTRTPPFATNGSGEINSVTYQGDARFPTLGLPEGSRMDLQLTGDAVISGGGEDMFQALIDLRDGLRTNTVDATSMLTRLEKIEDNLQERRVQAGSASKYLKDLVTTARSRSLQTSNELNRVADTDMAAAITEYTLAETVQNATLQVTARSAKLRLVDFLT